jgi:hypothetical protein
MGKTQATEADIASGIQSLGGFGNLGQRPRRDSPFGAEFAPKRIEPSPVAPVETRPEVKPQMAVSVTLEAPLSSKVETVSVTEVEKASPPLEVPIQKATPLKRARDVVAPTAKRVEKAEHFTERITLQMTPQMRDKLNDLARALQRSRADKAERVTANTVMRAAIQLALDSCKASDLQGISNEEELLTRMKKVR